MGTKNDNVNIFQKSLKDDTDMQASFISAGNTILHDSNSDSDEETCKIVFPKQKRSKHSDTSQDLLHELIKQQQVLSHTQKKMYKLQSAIDSEEISTRYIKLDLNNTQVKLDETTEKLNVCGKLLNKAIVENFVCKGIIIFGLVYEVYSYIF